ncbi:MAG: hypothetical protein H0T79_22820 [Deltaproteobacteria bacterium]|nr:hypothetical protein [Deltaproteobacteria bacterium]
MSERVEYVLANIMNFSQPHSADEVRIGIRCDRCDARISDVFPKDEDIGERRRAMARMMYRHVCLPTVLKDVARKIIHDSPLHEQYEAWSVAFAELAATAALAAAKP